jgi:hypothetical protein
MSSPFFRTMAAGLLAFGLLACEKSPSAEKPAAPADVMELLREHSERELPRLKDSYFFKVKHDSETGRIYAIIEMRGLQPSPTITAITLSEAEQLNGISERYAVTWGRARVYRMTGDIKPGFSGQVQWTPWKDVEERENSFLEAVVSPSVGIIRKDGKLILTFFPQFHDETRPSRELVKWAEPPLPIGSEEQEILRKDAGLETAVPPSSAEK